MRQGVQLQSMQRQAEIQHNMTGSPVGETRDEPNEAIGVTTHVRCQKWSRQYSMRLSGALRQHMLNSAAAATGCVMLQRMTAPASSKGGWVADLVDAGDGGLNNRVARRPVVAHCARCRHADGICGVVGHQHES